MDIVDPCSHASDPRCVCTDGRESERDVSEPCDS